MITLKNMRRVAKELGENLTDDELQAMIDEFDRDQDGAINSDECVSPSGARDYIVFLCPALDTGKQYNRTAQ
eukprot:SAG31_NODE_1485_length_8151_cov_6.486215_4_plen_72_part_00